MTREQAKSIANDTLERLNDLRFEINNKFYDLNNELRYCKLNTVTIGSKQTIDTNKLPSKIEPTIELTNESILEATSRLRDQRPCALNFANATEPGGGFKRGARAQEETIARSSGLYPAIHRSWYYDVHSENKTDFYYSDTMIYSPYVPVFKNDEGDLVEPYEASFITSAAPMRKSIESLEDPDPDELDEKLEEIIGERIDRVLKVAALFKHRVLILGAWGLRSFWK